MAGLLFAGLVGAILADPAVVSGQDLTRRKMRLEAESELARTPAIYLVVDTEAKELSLRGRGLTLKSWKASQMKLWGRPVGIGSLKVVKRSGWSAQDRVNLTPGLKPDEKTDAKKPKDVGDDVLEISDMPSRYQFVLERDIRISIRPRPRGLINKAAYGVAGLGRGIGRAAGIIWSALRSREFSEIRIIVSEAVDAQGIFWSVPEGTKILFY
jgi:hypothetical protein